MDDKQLASEAAKMGLSTEQAARWKNMVNPTPDVAPTSADMDAILAGGDYFDRSRGAAQIARQASTQPTNPEDDEARRRNAAQLVNMGEDPEKARQLSGVQARPGEIGPPLPPKMGSIGVNDVQEPPERPAVAASPGILIPGGRQPHSWETQVQEGIKPSENTEALRAAYREQGYRAIDAEAQAGHAQAAREVAYANTMAQQAAARQAQAQKDYDEQKKILADERATRDRLAQEVRSGAIDDQQLFKEKGLFGSFASAIGLALTSFVAGATGRENTGLKILQDQIAANMRKQEGNLANKRSALGDQDALLSKYGGNLNLAKANLENAYWEKAKTIAGQMAADSKDPAVQAAAAKATALFTGEQASKSEMYDRELQDHIVRKQTDINAPDRVVGGGPAAGGLGKGDNADLGEYVKETNKYSIPETLASLQNIDRHIDAFGKGDIPGVSYLLEHTPEGAVIGMNRAHLLSDEALNNRQAFLDIKAKIKHDISGAAITETEKPELAKLVDGAYTAEALRNVVNLARSKVAKKEANTRALLSDKALEEYNRRTQGRGVRTIQEDRPTTPTIKTPE